MDTSNKSTTAPLFAKSMAASQPFNERKLWANIFTLVSRGLCLIQRSALRDIAFQYHNLSVVSPPFRLCLRGRVAPDKTGYLGPGITTLSLVYFYFRGWRHGCGNASFIYASIQ